MTLLAAFNILVMVLIGLLGWFSRELWGAVKLLQEEIKNFKIEVPKVYIIKDDFKDFREEIMGGIRRIEDKLGTKADK